MMTAQPLTNGERMMQCEHLEEVNRYDLYYYYPDGSEAGYLCEDCARTAGFCPLCPAFIGGIESEMVSMHEFGMCSECVAAFEAETGAHDEDES